MIVGLSLPIGKFLAENQRKRVKTVGQFDCKFKIRGKALKKRRVKVVSRLAGNKHMQKYFGLTSREISRYLKNVRIDDTGIHISPIEI